MQHLASEERVAKGKHKKRRRDPVKPSDRVGPTPETLAKLKPDPFNVLVERGILDTAQRDAGLEIRAIYVAVTSSLMPGGANLIATRGRREMSDILAEIHAQVYVHWCARWGHKIERVIDLVYDACMPQEIMMNLQMADIFKEADTPENRTRWAGSVGTMLTDYARRRRTWLKLVRAA